MTTSTFELKYDVDTGICYVKKVIDELTKNRHESDHKLVTGFMPQLNKEASRLYAELLLCVCWHTEDILIGPFDNKLLNILIL